MHCVERELLQLALRLLKRLLRQLRVLPQKIKIGRQRPLALFFAADGGVGQNDRLRFKYKRLRALAHRDQLPSAFSGSMCAKRKK